MSKRVFISCGICSSPGKGVTASSIGALLEGRENQQGAAALKIIFALSAVIAFVFSACSFDYGRADENDGSRPDIVMRDVVYVRVQGGDPVVRFQAESAERYEEAGEMSLANFSFEQFENRGNEINARGTARGASVELDSGNIHLSGGVVITIESEDIIIETTGLFWRDSERQLAGERSELVMI